MVLCWLKVARRRADANLGDSGHFKEPACIWLLIFEAFPSFQGRAMSILQEALGLIVRGHTAVKPPALLQIERRNSIKSRLTSSGRSCWIQWPAPVSRTFRHRLGALASSVRYASAYISITRSLSPAMNRVGCASFAPARNPVSSHPRSMLRYQLSPPRNPVRLNSPV